MKWIEKKILFKSDRVIVLSQYMLHKLLTIHHCPEGKILKIPGGVNLNRFNLPGGGKPTAKNSLNLLLNKTIFLTVRNLVPRMGLEELIEAFNQSKILREKAFLMIGGKGFLENLGFPLVK